MKKRKGLLVLFSLLLCSLIWVGAAMAETEFIAQETIDVYAAPNASGIPIGKMRAGQSYYTSDADRQGSWHTAYYTDMEFGDQLAGWYDESQLQLPSVLKEQAQPAGTHGMVLCESLSIRSEPNTMASVSFTLSYMDDVEIMDTTGDWYQVRYVAMERDVIGYVLARYILPNPQYWTAAKDTPAFAYPSPQSKHVALLNANDRYAVIAALDGYLVISLRGASAFIQQ